MADLVNEMLMIINLLNIHENSLNLKFSMGRKLIVVTGGSRGIGRAILERFSVAGFDIITCSRNMKDLEGLKAAIGKNDPNVKIDVLRTDMSDKEEVKAFGAFINHGGRTVDVLVNNSGYFVPGEILTEPDGALESMINSNLYGAYHLTRQLAPGMKKKRSGHIFNICSIASLMAYKNGGSYAISKFALLGFSKCIREELKPFGVRVTSVIPGATFTRSWEGAGFPEDRFIRAEDIAEMVYAAYNLSPGSAVEELLIRPQLGDI